MVYRCPPAYGDQRFGPSQRLRLNYLQCPANYLRMGVEVFRRLTRVGVTGQKVISASKGFWLGVVRPFKSQQAHTTG